MKVSIKGSGYVGLVTAVTQRIGEIRQLIHKADTCGEHGVRRVFGKLCRELRHSVQLSMSCNRLMREAPSRVVLSAPVRAGASVIAHDPAAIKVARQIINSDLSDDPGAWARVSFADSPEDALNNADALNIMTEWELYKSFDLTALATLMKSSVVFDGRNLFDPTDMHQKGIEYFCVGRTPTLTPPRHAALLPLSRDLSVAT